VSADEVFKNDKQIDVLLAIIFDKIQAADRQLHEHLGVELTDACPARQPVIIKLNMVVRSWRGRHHTRTKVRVTKDGPWYDYQENVVQSALSQALAGEKSC
jgi:hypothetical protein